MNWEYEFKNNNEYVEVYDHRGDLVDTVENNDAPVVRRQGNIPTSPDIRAAIREYISGVIESDTFPNDEAKMRYVQKTQTVLAANAIEERK